MSPRVTRVNLLLIIGLSLAITSCQRSLSGDDDLQAPGAPSPVEIRFKSLAGPFRDLKLDSTYALFPTFVTIKTFKYYISNIAFMDDKGDTFRVPDSYFLIDQANPNSLKPQFMIPAGGYFSMSFLIGIDHNRNMNGPHTGQLDPSLGMYWNATDGHIMGKLEGTSPGSTAPNNVFSFHVGGTKDPFNVLATRTFKLNGPIAVQPNRKAVIEITADALTWFRNPHGINLSVPCTGPGDLSDKIAENYYKMFNFVSVKFE